MTGAPEAALEDLLEDLLGSLLGDLLVLGSELAHALTPGNCSLLSALGRAELLACVWLG